MAWRAEDHTADALLVVEAAHWPALLAEAARAFGAWTGGRDVASLAPRAGGTGPLVRRIETDGADATETWVRFWRALHRLLTVEGLLAVGAEVEAGSDEERVRAAVRVVPAASLALDEAVDVKAVTWHGAEAGALPDGTWRGQIVLDI